MIDLRPDHLEIVRDLLRQHVPGCEVRAFGSRFKWTAKQASDLDLAVVGTKRLPAKKILRLKEAFEESILPMRVDVLDWHAITPEFQRVIDAGFEVIQGGEVSPLATASSPSAAGSSATPLDARAFSGLSSEQPNWPVVRLGDYADTCLGKMLDQNKNKGSFHPYLGNSDVRWGRFDLSSLSSMRFEDDEHERYGLKFGDLVVCEGGEPGRAAIWRDEIPNMKIQKALHRIRARDAFDNQFLYYWFLFAGRSGLLEPFFTGTTIKHLPGQALANLQVPKPPIEYQKSIAYVLGKLDDRIELCRRTNETLESTARALFKDWFIDFGPVRAKLEGREPYLSADIWSLFPDRLVDSDLGEIPEGWNSTTWGSLITLEYGKSLRDYRENNGIYRVYGTNGPIGFCDQALCETSGIVIGRKGAYRGVHYSPEPFFVIDTAFYLKPKSLMSILWAFYEIKRFDINGMDSGSAIPSTSRPDFYGIAVVEPSQDIQKAFESTVGELYKRIAENNQSIDSYGKLRDSLLPKLLSGELSIPEAMLRFETLK